MRKQADIGCCTVEERAAVRSILSLFKVPLYRTAAAGECNKFTLLPSRKSRRAEGSKEDLGTLMSLKSLESLKKKKSPFTELAAAGECNKFTLLPSRKSRRAEGSKEDLGTLMSLKSLESLKKKKSPFTERGI